MRTRQKRRTKTTGAIIKLSAAIFLITAAAAAIWYGYPTSAPTTGTREFFSDDDGNTWFPDDGTRIAPFDHNGKQAVLAKVYQTQSGRQFVGYLMKFTDVARDKIIQAQATHHLSSGISATSGPAFNGLLVKKPHQPDWVADSDPKAATVRTVTAPDGSKDFMIVRP